MWFPWIESRNYEFKKIAERTNVRTIAVALSLSTLAAYVPGYAKAAEPALVAEVPFERADDADEEIIPVDESWLGWYVRFSEDGRYALCSEKHWLFDLSAKPARKIT